MKKFSDFLEGRCWPGYKPKPGKTPYSPGSCVKEEDMEEGWSQKYKSSINCSHPKGFSQKAHCAGKKKQNESVEMEHVCPDCGMCETHGGMNESAAAAIAAATAIAKKKSGNYDKEGFRKTPYKNPDSPNRKTNDERRAELKEDLRKWFSKTDPKGDWKRINSKGEAIGPCAREPGEPKPKCMSQGLRASLSKKERASAVRRKRQQDPNAERQGAPINVKSKVNENMEQINEKNKPTNPELWSRAIAQAKSKFDVYPSAYANGWASKWYKSKGGGWKSVSEASEVGDDPTTQEMPDGLAKKGSKTMIKRFKEISEIVMPQVKGDLDVLDKTSFVKKHGITKSLAKQRLATEAKDEQEYGYEGDMALNQLATLIRCGEMIKDMLKPDTDMPEWVQSKITLATDYIQTAADYMYSEMKEEVLDELSKDKLNAYMRAGHKAYPSASPDKKRKLSVGIKTAYNKANPVVKQTPEKKIDMSSPAAYYKSARPGQNLGDSVEIDDTPLQEGRPSQRHPLEGHEYHKKSDAELVHIAKDAHAAAEAMKSHNTTAENKYRDQANDSATVRHFRKTSGTPDWYKKKYGHMKEAFKPMDEPNYNNSIQARQKKADDANKPPFDGPYKKSNGVVKDKSGAVHTAQSMAKDAAHRGMQMAMKKKGIKESKQASIVRDAVKTAKDKKKSASEDKFQADPVLSNSITRNV